MNSREKLYKSIIKEYEDQNVLVGKTLHEYIAQDLYAIRLTLQRYSIENGHSLPIDQVKEILNGTIGKVQQMANDLLPAVLRDFGLQRALEDLIHHYYGIKNTVLIENAVHELDYSCHVLVFHLVTLMLKATYIQSDSAVVVIKLNVNKDSLYLEMEGLSEHFIQHVKNQNKESIKKLQERVNLFEGTLDINTSSHRNNIVVIVKLN